MPASTPLRGRGTSNDFRSRAPNLPHWAVVLDEQPEEPDVSFRQLIDSLPDGIVVTTTEGRIIAVNERMCALAGHSRDTLEDTGIETLIPSPVRARHVALRSAYIADGAPRARCPIASTSCCCAPTAPSFRSISR
jgi:PAS domain-containing protein